MKRLPPRRPDALKLHTRDLNLTPVQRYVDIMRARGKLITIGQVDVDIDQVIERPFLCDRHRCIQWKPHDKKSENPLPIIDNSCCARYQVPVTDWDQRKLAEILPLVRKRLDRKHPLVVDPTEVAYEIDDEFAFLMKDQPNGACQFVIYDQGMTACAIHKTCLEEGLDPWHYKPLGCSLWPAALVDYETDDKQDRYLLTVYADPTKGIFVESEDNESDESKFACLVDQDEAYEPAYKSMEGILTYILGAEFYQKLDREAGKWLAAHRASAARPAKAKSGRKNGVHALYVKIGVDTGGTFTDVVARTTTGALRVVKRLSTPGDPDQAVLDGIGRATDGAPVTEVIHSTTVATNALLERRGGPALLVTTAGFQDVLEIGRQARPSLYALHPVVPPPLVEARHRLGVVERLAHDGSVITPLDAAVLDELRERVRAIVASDGIRAIAVCLLHAHVNPAHERAVRDALQPLGLPVSISSDVLPVMREYERTSTTVVDAYVQPVMAPYLDRLSRALSGARLRVMQSNGGAMSAAEAAAQPVRTLLSGPAAGVVGALRVARAAGLADEGLITFDMGGTSTDVCLVAGGALDMTEAATVAGCPIQLPMLAIHTIGAGGGSIARVDEGGALKVGPQSAGADPGPAAYGRGGTLPTVTDANLLLGRLDPDRFLGGEMTLDEAAARGVIDALAAQLGKPVEAAAEDVVAVADAVMARAIKAISVERGHDPAGFVLVPFGGAGAMHACEIARELGMRRVLIPPAPGLLCAYGALAADTVHDLVHTLLLDAGPRLPARALAGELDRLTLQAEERLDADGVPAAHRARQASATLRYQGQSFELAIPLDGPDTDLVAAFHDAHRARYGYAFDGVEPSGAGVEPSGARVVELVTLRLRAIGVADVPPFEVATEATDETPRRRTCIHRGRAFGAAVYARAGLAVGATVAGPALVVEYSATTFLPPDVSALVLPGGALLVTLS